MRQVGSGRPLSAEHQALYRMALRVIERLAAMPQAISASPAAHQHGYAERARHLSDHLNAAILCASNGLHGSAFSVLRTALEHACVDELLLLASRYRETMHAEQTDFDRLETEWRQGEVEWASSVQDMTYEPRNRLVRLTRIGHSVWSPDRTMVVEHLSPYDPVVDEHDALLGSPDDQEGLADAFANVERLREWASRNRYSYNRFLRWPAIVSNLVLNDRYSERQIFELEVHYRFLSAFTHATGTGYRMLDRRQHFPAMEYVHEHLLGELVLLYAISIGVTELRTFVAYADVRPQLDLNQGSEMERVVEDAARLTSYFWFPRIGEPVPCDFFEEANRRAFPNGQFERHEASPRPDQLTPPELSYYSDPLRRLESLHVGAAEMSTGFHFDPMW